MNLMRELMVLLLAILSMRRKSSFMYSRFGVVSSVDPIVRISLPRAWRAKKHLFESNGFCLV